MDLEADRRGMMALEQSTPTMVVELPMVQGDARLLGSPERQHQQLEMHLPQGPEHQPLVATAGEILAIRLQPGAQSLLPHPASMMVGDTHLAHRPVVHTMLPLLAAL